MSVDVNFVCFLSCSLSLSKVTSKTFITLSIRTGGHRFTKSYETCTLY